MRERENRACCCAVLCELVDLLRRNTSAKIEIARQFSDHDVIAVEDNSNLLEAGCWSNKVIGTATLDETMNRGFASINLSA
jgi:hypothetical protein